MPEHNKVNLAGPSLPQEPTEASVDSSSMAIDGKNSQPGNVPTTVNDPINPAPGDSTVGGVQASATAPTAEPTSVDQHGDPLSLAQYRHGNVTRRHMKTQHPEATPKLMKKYYTKQNELIDQFLNSSDEERLKALDTEKYGPKVKFAVNASSTANVCLFIIQLYAAVSTGSLSLFATAADAFMDVVSSITMLITSRMAARQSVYKYPVGRTRIEVIGIILFCALMSTVAVQLIVESARGLGAGEKESKPLQIIPIAFVSAAIAAKGILFIYCFILRRYPAANVFMYDHRNDIIVNIFGLSMSIVGSRVAWWVDPFGAICIGCLILLSWVSTAFEHVWLLVGKGAPKEFIGKVIYMALTHSEDIQKIDTCRAYHAGTRYYVEVDVIMDQNAPLKVTHDVSQTLQRKIEGLADVERAFVHVDYEDEHDIKKEHKPIGEEQKQRRSLKELLSIGKKKTDDEERPAP